MSVKTTRTQNIPAVEYARAVGVAFQLRRESVLYRDQAAAGSIRLMDIETGLLSTLRNVRVELKRALATPGIVAYGKTQIDTAYEFITEFDDVVTEIDATLVWLEGDFPVDAGGRLLAKTFVGDGLGNVKSELWIAPAVLAALTTRLNALIATID